METRIQELMLEGYCCSQIIMLLGLEKLDKDNPDLVKSMAGLCKGMQLEKTCGTLSAAFCLLALADPRKAQNRYIPELNQWFLDTFDSTDCDELVKNDPSLMATLCPELMRGTFDKISDMMEW
jgi:hypothetical protein